MGWLLRGYRASTGFWFDGKIDWMSAVLRIVGATGDNHGETWMLLAE
jgi:hypothetical protein